jgi:predicted membrane protein
MNDPNGCDNWRERRAQRMSRFTVGGVYGGHGTPSSHVVFGIIVLLLGILFLLENLGFVYIRDIWQFWPVILIGVGIARVFESHDLHGTIGGVIIAGIGLIFMANSLGYLPWYLWSRLWPVLLIGGGLLMILRGFSWGGHWSGPHSFVDESSSTSENVLKEEVVFGGINRRVDSQDFQGGRATAVFGGVEIDLRKASTTKDIIEIHADAVFGGVEIMVPETWDVTVRGAGVLGGYEDKTHPVPMVEGVKRPRLIIRGSAVFGGVTVRN